MRTQDYERHTDDDWENIAKENPYWGVLSHDNLLDGKIDKTAKAYFFSSGFEFVDDIVKVKMQMQDTELESVLDFGSGVGRLLIPMAARAKRAVGIEVSKTMIKELKRNLGDYKMKNVDVFQTIEDMQKSCGEITFDWINSYIVFQHIPPVRGYQILKQLLSMLRIGGCFSLHFNIFSNIPSKGLGIYQQIDASTIKVLYSDEESLYGRMSMYDYDLNQIFAIFLKNGISEFKCYYEDHVGAQTVRIFGKRTKRTNLKEKADAHSFLLDSEKWAKDIVQTEGFSHPESWGSWTTLKEAAIEALLQDSFYGKDLCMNLKACTYLGAKKQQPFKVYINDALVFEHISKTSDVQDFKINIPAKSLGGKNQITIKFAVAELRSPKELGNADGRELGLGIHGLEINAV